MLYLRLKKLDYGIEISHQPLQISFALHLKLTWKTKMKNGKRHQMSQLKH